MALAYQIQQQLVACVIYHCTADAAACTLHWRCANMGGCLPACPAGNMVLSGSIDASARLWEVRSGRCLSVKTGHTDEVLDVAFNTTGSSFVSASADGTARCGGSSGCYAFGLK